MPLSIRTAQIRVNGRRERKPEPVTVVTIDGHRVPYRVVRSSRARRVRLRIGAEPLVEVIAPAGYRLGDVGAVLHPHLRWILRHLQRTPAKPPAPGPLCDGAILPFEGCSLTLVLVPGRAGYTAVEPEGERLVVTIHEDDRAGLPHVLEGWYRDQARQRIMACAERWAGVMGVTFGRITIRDQRSRWGSCSSLGNLNFSWRLVMAPPPVLEYVVIHELMHRREPNHGRTFWMGVERYCPNYKEHIRWLRDHGHALAAVLAVPP